MVTEYKVIKPFSCAEIGDIFTWDNDSKVYECTSGQNSDSFYSSKYISINETVATQYAKSGLLEVTKEDTPTQNNSEVIVTKLLQEINTLKEIYDRRKAKIESKYEAGKMPTCQKVEHDTVYFNLMKVLNKFESIINE